MPDPAYADLAHLVTFRPLERPLDCDWRASPFSSPWTKTIRLLERELRLHGAEQVVLEIDFRERDLRLDGFPRADRRAQSPGVVLSFTAVGVPGSPKLRYEVATFDDWRDNLRAVALGLEALRAVDRYGVTKRGEQYAGWVALPSPQASLVQRGRDLIREHGDVRRALVATHPDHGGDPEDFKAVTAARGA